MTFFPSLFAAVVAVLLLSSAVPAQDTYGDDPYDAPREPPVTIRGLADLRVVRPGRDLASSDGGAGKARYGGHAGRSGAHRTTRFALAQGAIEISATAPGGIRLQAQVNWEAQADHFGDITNDGWPRLIEAFARREWGPAANGWSLQAGVLNPPFSLEQLGAAWTPRFTLTPSAANTWLWEEIRVVGAEVETWRDLAGGWRADAYAGFGWGPDAAGLLLAQRGWVLSDFLSGINSELRIPGSANRVAVFDERDGRPAWYAGATLHDPWRLAELRAGYFDNLGDADVRRVWQTRFGSAGLQLQPLSGLHLLVQAVVGDTATRGAQWDSTFVAWYPLASYRWRNHRLSMRYDRFAVHDDDAGGARSRERGEAVTAAYLFEFWMRHRIALEYLHIDSERRLRSGGDPDDDQWQLSYRFRY